ncbi:MAG TPA: hypothetical protein VFY15_01410 [Acidimicrobiia bacterium]|nr:hypothetical protein [Acidimicrobiia bacterium]
MTVIPGEGRVPILYGHQPMPTPPHLTGYVARPDTVSPHPALAIATGSGVTAASATLARFIARHGFAAVVPPESPGQLAACVDAFGAAWAEWTRRDRRAVAGVGSGADRAVQVAAERGLPLLLLDPDRVTADAAGCGPVLTLAAGAVVGLPGRVVAYGSVSTGFWDDASPGYDIGAGRDAFDRIVAFLDRHLGLPAAA